MLDMSRESVSIIDLLSLGGVPIGGVLNSGARINVDGAANLIRTIDALVQGSIIGGGGDGGVNIGNGIRNGGNGYDVDETGDSGGVGMASNLSTSDSEGNGIESSKAEMELRRAGAGTVGA
nr:hypothetical protein [Tanacetum cinerariifolium]